MAVPGRQSGRDELAAAVVAGVVGLGGPDRVKDPKHPLTWRARQIRTRDPLLRRHIRTVAGRRLASPYEPSSSSYCRWPSAGVARRLSALAPLLAPRNLVAFANVRMVENNVALLLLRRVACEPSHPSCSAASSTAVEERALSRRSVRPRVLSTHQRARADQVDLAARLLWAPRERPHVHPLSAPAAGAVHGVRWAGAGGRIAGVRWRIRPFAQAADREWAEGLWAAAMAPSSWPLLPAGIAMPGAGLVALAGHSCARQASPSPPRVSSIRWRKPAAATAGRR